MRRTADSRSLRNEARVCRRSGFETGWFANEWPKPPRVGRRAELPRLPLRKYRSAPRLSGSETGPPSYPFRARVMTNDSCDWRKPALPA